MAQSFVELTAPVLDIDQVPSSIQLFSQPSPLRRTLTVHWRKHGKVLYGHTHAVHTYLHTQTHTNTDTHEKNTDVLITLAAEDRTGRCINS